MIVRNQDMWNDEPGLRIVTTNSSITSRGNLVMGRGAALEAKQKFPGIDFSAGSIINNLYGRLSKYGFIVIWHKNNMLGLFQVKYTWMQDANLDLIKYSTEQLINYIKPLEQRYYHMNFPGIGNGRLNYDSVYDIIKALPDNVFIYTKEKIL